MDVCETRLATPVSAELKSELAGIFKMIGEKATTAEGLERLYDFSQAHPMVDTQSHLARTSGAFQNYIKKGLSKVEAARAAHRAAAGAASGAGTGDNSRPLIAPSPMPQVEKSAAEVYRERLARMQAAKEGAAAAAGAGAGAGAGVGTNAAAAAVAVKGSVVAGAGAGAASAGLSTLRERMVGWSAISHARTHFIRRRRLHSSVLSLAVTRLVRPPYKAHGQNLNE